MGSGVINMNKPLIALIAGFFILAVSFTYLNLLVDVHIPEQRHINGTDLVSNGYTNVYNIKNGPNEWASLGYPL